MINDKSILAFIPGKTGSVGLPNKLFKTIGGYSLLEWTLLAAMHSRYIDKVVTSSNDPRIKEAVESFSSNKERCEFLQRPDELCSPVSKTEEAIKHLLTFYGNYDYLIMLQGTSPCRRMQLIDKCIETLVRGNYDSLITVKKTTPFFWRKDRITGDAFPSYSLKDRPMRQELLESDYQFFDNGNIYITKIECFRESGLRVSGTTCLYETPEFESMQIDDQEDFDMMSSLFNTFGGFL